MPETTTAIRQFRGAAQIRREFIDFFCEKHGHTFAPSSPVVPHDDPTLLFTNAGMNQFKDVFLGQGTRPYRRAANSQKCIRAGGKHNDLEDVGKDTYHHTFFEMLGNWSFGDYFKKEAIAWAWELLVDLWGVDPTRLYATYFEGDKSQGLEPDFEARDLWLKYLPEDHVLPGNMKDNFWEMGDTGPCGPCSEIHYDATPGKGGRELVNMGDPRVIEIWNLVFIQFNRNPGSHGQPGKLVPLPAKHVDTGMGFERITRVLQEKDSNYNTDIWTPIFEAIRKETGAREYGGSLVDAIDVAYRVVADHIRCLTIAITDGAVPSNEGRGYVLRRILRRAVRIARQTLGVGKPVLCDLIPAVVQSLGEAFPELKKDPKRVSQIVRAEEEAFLKTIDRGIELFEAACGAGRSQRISAEDAFKLHDTFGFPIDLTCVMAEERGMTVDVAGFEALMEQARETSRAGGAKEEAFTLTPSAIDELKRQGVKPTDDHHKYNPRPLTAKIEAIWNGTDFDNVARIGRRVAIVLSRTNHYAESGGQVGDAGGTIAHDYERGREAGRFMVEDTQAVAGFVLHIGRVTDGTLRVGEEADVKIDRKSREPIQANHTATHLLNFALREVIGEEVEQKGSLVAEDRLRFDFSASRAMKPGEIEHVESIVNDLIGQDLAVHAEELPVEQAKSITGVRAVFGEKYPDPVRVVAIGPSLSDVESNPADAKWRQFSIEFCGGTHLKSTGEAKQFVLTQEGALAAGVRRVTALTGEDAKRSREAGERLVRRIADTSKLEGDELLREFDAIAGEADHIVTSAAIKSRIQSDMDLLREKVKQVRKQSQASARDEVVEQARKIADAHGRDARATKDARATIIVEQIPGADKDMLLVAMDVIRAKCAASAIMLFSADHHEGKVSIAASVPKELIAKGLKAGDWVREAAKACGGGGGGRPDMAQAGGKDPSKVDEAMGVAREFAQRTVA